MAIQLTQDNMNFDSWKQKGVREVNAIANKAEVKGKWLFLWDKSGSVSTFFKYKAAVCEFDCEVKQVRNGRQT